MGKIKLDSSSWSLEVFNYSSTVDLIGKLQAMSLEDTDLQPFKKLNKTIQKICKWLLIIKWLMMQQVQKVLVAKERKNESSATTLGPVFYRGVPWLWTNTLAWADCSYNRL